MFKLDPNKVYTLENKRKLYSSGNELKNIIKYSKNRKIIEYILIPTGTQFDSKDLNVELIYDIVVDNKRVQISKTSAIIFEDNKTFHITNSNWSEIKIELLKNNYIDEQIVENIERKMFEIL